MCRLLSTDLVSTEELVDDLIDAAAVARDRGRREDDRIARDQLDPAMRAVGDP